MTLLEKLLESLDAVISGTDKALEESEDVVLNESFDEDLTETIDKYFEDLDVTLSKWSDEDRQKFMEGIDQMLEDSEPELFEEKNIVRLDRNTVFNQLVGLFSLVIARRKKDPAFAIYAKGSALRRKGKQAIKKKYASRAVPLARKYLKNRRFKA